ncbi:MAG: DNA translocase FtsK [Candidatus Moranbacteria bacterium]|nr:DNA translocase FtsK [Candidatus Moranbacteria bacterium]NTW75422.1 DNA translocase FtsK [Candidatus Moranbacteria bacterium]
MGRKKIEEKPKRGRPRKVVEDELEEETGAGGWGEAIGGDVKRSIAAIFLVAFAILFLFAFFGAGGKFGGWLGLVVGTLFGWGKWLFPALLFVSAAFLLRRRTTTLSDIVKFVGLGVVFLSSLGFFHLFLGESTQEMLVFAKNGSGGGYVGYGVAAFLFAFTGRGAGAVILSALLLSGIVAAFNVSLIHFLSFIRERIADFQNAPERTVPSVGEEPIAQEPVLVEPDEPESKPALDEPDLRGNIGTISFPEEHEETSDDGSDVEDVSEVEETSLTRLPVVRSARKRQPSIWNQPDADFFRGKSGRPDSGDLDRTSQIIQSTLKYFNISGEMGETTVGPTVTQYTFSPAFGTKLSKIVGLSNDLALALAKHPIRIEAPIPNKSLVGIEVPNTKQASVRMRDILESPTFSARKSNLSFVLGESVSGEYEVADLESMPHLLIAGRTGSGKSVCINSVILSLLYQNSPEDLQLILIDPKRVELSLYNEIPHLKSGRVITDSKHVVNALKYAIGEMERRLRIFETVRVRDLGSYREKERRGETYVDKNGPDGKPRTLPLEPMPYIVVVIDEMADLMMSHGKEVEGAIVRLAQMSRAAGIHLVLATQKPVSDVVTGLIKSNIPGKIAFAVSNQMDSRIILDTGGAEKLIGKGDMLYAPPESSQPKRIQGVYVDDREVKDIVRFFIDQKKELGEENLDEDFDDGEEDGGASLASSVGDVDFTASSDDPNDQDEKYAEARQLVIESGRAATTFLQRRLSVGYGRAAKLLDLLEENGVVGPPEGANKGRPVLVGKFAGQSDVPEYDDPMSDQANRDKWQIG